MTKKFEIMASALVAMTLTVAGCGSQQAAQPNTNEASASRNTAPVTAAVSFDPCTVLGAEEVTAVIGDKITQTAKNDHSCEYHAGPNDTDGTQIMIYKTGGKEQMQDIRKADQLLSGIGGAVSKQGDVGKDVQASITPPAEGGAPTLGDEAVWEPNAVLAVRKGDLFVQVTPPIVRFGANGSFPKMHSDAEKRLISQKLAVATLTKLEG